MYTVKTLREAASLPGRELNDDGLRAVRLSSDDYPTQSPPAAINRGGSAILATTPTSGSPYRGGTILLEQQPAPPLVTSVQATPQHPQSTPYEPPSEMEAPAPAVRHRTSALAAPRERREHRTSRPSRAGPKSDDDPGEPEPPRRPLAARHEWAVWLARRSRELRELQERERPADAAELQLSFGEAA
jgi:hypothetical protein